MPSSSFFIIFAATKYFNDENKTYPFFVWIAVCYPRVRSGAMRLLDGRILQCGKPFPSLRRLAHS